MKNVLKAAAGLILGLVMVSCDDYCIEGKGPVETRELALPQITSFSFSGSGNVYIQQGPEQRVIVEAQSNILDRLDSRVSGGHWDIDFDGCIGKSEDLNIYLTVSELEYISLSGSGRINGVNEADEFNELGVNLSGSGQIELDVYTGSVEVDITGSGMIRLHGAASHQKVYITGSGDYKGYGMEVNTAEVNISGSGNAQVLVNQELDVRIQGSGNVFYHGNPEVHANITGSGNVIKN